MSKKSKINTRLFSTFLAVLILAASLPFTGLNAFAASIRYGDDFDYYMRESGNIAIRYLGNEASVIVPSEIDGYTVTELSAEAFIERENLTDITLPDSITVISNYAFIGSDNLKDIYYGGSEKQWNEISIDPDNNDPLFNATIHYNYDGPLFTPTISDMMTSGDLKYRYSLEDGTAEIYDCTVYEPYEDETDVTIPSELDGHTVTAIGKWSFYSSAVKNVTIPNTVTSIGENAFSFCLYLTNITIPGGVKRIENNTFDSCFVLSEITIPSDVTSIGRNAFFGCNSLTDVYFNGTEEQWNVITIEDNNDPLINATIHFIEVEEPTEQATDEPSTDTVVPSQSPAIDPIVIVIIAVAVAGAVIIATVIIKKKKSK